MTNAERLPVADQARIAWARLYAALGWTGVMGVTMAAVAVGLSIWLHHLQTLTPADLSQPIQNTVPTPGATAPERAETISPPDLPRTEQQVEILQRIKSQVQRAGLAWPKADYKLVRLSDEQLAHLEIHTTFKGPYPKLRLLITALLNKEPALALRELSLQRTNSDAPDVEAKLQFVVFLANDWPPATGVGKP